MSQSVENGLPVWTQREVQRSGAVHYWCPCGYRATSHDNLGKHAKGCHAQKRAACPECGLTAAMHTTGGRSGYDRYCDLRVIPPGSQP